MFFLVLSVVGITWLGHLGRVRVTYVLGRVMLVGGGILRVSGWERMSWDSIVGLFLHRIYRVKVRRGLECSVGTCV